MVSPGEISLLCRLCLVKDQVNVPIFGEQGDIRQIFLKISSCLPVTVSKEDQLPKNICEGCSDKLDLLFAFWNSSRDAEKTLVSWLKQASVDNANETINAIAKQISAKPVAEVKQETDDGQNIKIQQSSEEGKNDESEEAPPPPKRARRTAAVKAQISISQEDESEEEEDDVDAVEPLTKVEDESDMSDNDGADNQPLSSFVDMPGTSADDQEQAGPSGVGKDGGADAPTPSHKSDISIEGLAGHSCFPTNVNPKQPLYKRKGWPPPPYVCSYCNKKFNKYNYHHLIRHEAKHAQRESDKSSFRCKRCRLIFETKKELGSHKYLVHKKVPQAVCDICGFKTKHIARHKLIHADSKPVRCSICAKTFRASYGLKKHMLVHANEAKHQCAVCGKAFKFGYNLTVHMRIHNGVKPFACSVCDKTFTTKQWRDKHLLSH